MCVCVCVCVCVFKWFCASLLVFFNTENIQMIILYASIDDSQKKNERNAHKERDRNICYVKK